jgi:hypothetical protein
MLISTEMGFCRRVARTFEILKVRNEVFYGAV